MCCCCHHRCCCCCCHNPPLLFAILSLPSFYTAGAVFEGGKPRAAGAPADLIMIFIMMIVIEWIMMVVMMMIIGGMVMEIMMKLRQTQVPEFRGFYDNYSFSFCNYIVSLLVTTRPHFRQQWVVEMFTSKHLETL